MAHPIEHAQHAGSKMGDILQKETAGMPNWAWLAIIAAGIAAAYIVPKFLGSGNSSNSPTNQPDQASQGNGTNQSGLGLAIDPTTGLPYAVEGLVPSGGISASPNGVNTTSTGTTATQATPDLTATNTLLQQILAMLQGHGRPHHGKTTPTPPPTHTKTTDSGKVPSGPVLFPGGPRPKTPTQPVLPVPTPTPSRPKSKSPILTGTPVKPVGGSVPTGNIRTMRRG